MLNNLQNENDRRSTSGFLHTCDMYRANLAAPGTMLHRSWIFFEAVSIACAMCYVVCTLDLESQVTFLNYSISDHILNGCPEITVFSEHSKFSNIVCQWFSSTTVSRVELESLDSLGLMLVLSISTISSYVFSICVHGCTKFFNNWYVDGPQMVSKIKRFLPGSTMLLASK